MAGEDSQELHQEEGYDRLKADPAISTADLESCLNTYMGNLGYRNLNEVCSLIKEEGCTWKGAAKAPPHKISLNLWKIVFREGSYDSS